MGAIPIRAIVGGGLLGAAVSVYLALVGLLARFADLNLIGEQVTLGRVLLALPPFVVGYVVTRPRVVAGERRVATPGQAAFAGAAAGLVAAAAFGATIAFVEWFDINRVREVFIAASPALIEFITFEQGVMKGIVILIGLGVVAAAIGERCEPARRRCARRSSSALG